MTKICSFNLGTKLATIVQVSQTIIFGVVLYWIIVISELCLHDCICVFWEVFLKLSSRFTLTFSIPVSMAYEILTSFSFSIFFFFLVSKSLPEKLELTCPFYIKGTWKPTAFNGLLCVQHLYMSTYFCGVNTPDRRNFHLPMWCP